MLMASVILSGTAQAVSALDTTFTDPIVNRFVNSIAVQTDGKILIGGEFTAVSGVERYRIARLNSNGTLDSDFNPNADNSVTSVAVQPDGKILIGGKFSNVGTPPEARNRIARLNADGSLDTTFTDPNANNSVFSIALQVDGKILIGGDFTTVGGVARNRIARLNADGTLDTTFTDTNANGSVWSIALQADGKILIGSDFTIINGVARNRIARLGSNGTLDSDFNPNADNTVSFIAVQPDGKILIGGNFTNVGIPSAARNYIARLNADGSLDTGFNPDANSSVFTIALQADGNILIGGSFTVVGGEQRNRIARLDSNGTIDMGFNPYPNNPVNSIAVQSDGKILLGGLFTTFGNPADRLQRYIARLNAGFTVNPGAVKIEGDGRAFYAINSTLVECITTPGKTVFTRNMDFAEEVIMASPVSILLKGGYTDDAFTTQEVSSKTVINGSLKVRNGTLRVERLSVRPGTINSDPVQYTLTANTLGNGWGAVTSSIGGIGYTYPAANTGSAMIYSGENVTLTATAANSTVAWSDGCSTSGGTTTEANCAITGMNALRTVTANFTANPATVKIEGDDTSYYVIDSTLGSITTTDKTVRTRDLIFVENVIMESPVAIQLKGGYTDDAFSSQGVSSKTVIDGSLKIRNGTLRVERLCVR